MTLILTDFTERVGRSLTHFSDEEAVLFKLFKISSISEVRGYPLPINGYIR